MPRTVRARTVELAALTAGEGVTPLADGWHIGLNAVEWTGEETLSPGWYRLRIDWSSRTRQTLRKRAELRFSHGECESLTWNGDLRRETMIELPRGSNGLTVTLHQAVGDLEVREFTLKRVAGPALSVAALREKWKLLKAYRCLAPVLLRGGRMLAKARFRDFHRKVLKGLRDGRVMLAPEGDRPAEIDDSATWVRRHALPTEIAERVRLGCDAMVDPPFLSVILPVDDATAAEARQAVRAVRRQIYPHWELLIAGTGTRRHFAEFTEQAKREPRLRVHWADSRDGHAASIAKAVQEAGGDRALILPPTAELAEDALFRWACELQQSPTAEGIAGELRANEEALDGGPQSVWMVNLAALPGEVPAGVEPAQLAAWATANIGEVGCIASNAIAYPLDERSLLERSRLGDPPTLRTQHLHIATDLIGINGWGHVAYAVLRGLPTFGVEFVQHPATRIKAELLPDACVPEAKLRHPTDKQLAIVPPFLLPRFGPDRNTAVFTMWETDAIPANAVESLNRCGLVMVPSEWNRENFRRCGVTTPIEVVPLGFDRTTYSADGSFPELCTFGAAGALSAGGLRKNLGKVVELFRSAFPNEPNVRLRLKITPDSLPVETFDDPRIDQVRTILPHAEMLAWYRSLTAFVNTSFGEGFGLHLIEAMACGRPIVTPNYSGLTAFFEPNLGYAVDYELAAVNNDIYCGRWAIPDDADTIDALRRILADPAEAKHRGELSAKKARGFHWKQAGRKLHAAMVKHGFLEAAR